MATKKKATRKTTTRVEEPIDLDDELDAFDRAKRDFAGEPGVRLTVYRYDDGETAYLKRIAYDHATVDEEWIRKKWGPGTYQLRFTDEDGERHWSKVVQIASDLSPADAQRGGPGASGDALFIATIQKQNEIMLQAVLQGLASKGAAPSGDTAPLVALIEAQAAQTTAILNSALNRPDISTTLLSVLERGMAIASEHQADAEGGWLAQVARIAKDVLPSMAEMARARAIPPGAPPGMPVAGAGVSSPPSAGALPAGAPPKGAPASPPAAGPLLDVDELARGYAPAILEAIEKGTAPDDVADVILGYLPPAVYDELEALTAERAIRAAPALSQHRPYVEQLVASLREAIREDAEPQP